MKHYEKFVIWCFGYLVLVFVPSNGSIFETSTFGVIIFVLSVWGYICYPIWLLLDYYQNNKLNEENSLKIKLKRN